MWRLLMINFLLFSALPSPFQETEPLTVWPIEQHCAGEPTLPSDDWIFEGRLLLESPGKLHVYQQGWETPRIQVFYHDEIPYSGVLSPNGQWYAIIQGDRNDVNMMVVWKTTSIDVYDTQTGEKYSVEWKNSFSAIHRLFGHGLYWIDNEHLLYSRGDIDEKWFVINPFLGEITEWNNEFTPNHFADIVSPDVSKLLYREDWSDENWMLFNQTQEIALPIWGLPVWHPDSTQFAGFIHQPNIFTAHQLVVFDVEGNIGEVIYDTAEPISSFLTLNWSPSGQYFLFTAGDSLYVADMKEQQVIDLCITTTPYITTSWSPSSTQFTVVEPYSETREIQIFDTETWQRFFVGYHSGTVVGWIDTN